MDSSKTFKRQFARALWEQMCFATGSNFVKAVAEASICQRHDALASPLRFLTLAEHGALVRTGDTFYPNPPKAP